MKDILLDLLVMGRQHSAYCQDMLEQFRPDNFTPNRLNLMAYYKKYQDELDSKFAGGAPLYI